MKKIEAIVRKTHFEDVKQALFEADINWFSYSEVKAIVCREQFVQPAIDAIMAAARTGEVGDGRIFVSDVIDTWSIRTGEHGDTVLRDKK